MIFRALARLGMALQCRRRRNTIRSEIAALEAECAYLPVGRRGRAAKQATLHRLKADLAILDRRTESQQ